MSLHGIGALNRAGEPASEPCPCRKSDPDIMVMQSAEDWQRKNAPGGMDASMENSSSSASMSARLRLPTWPDSPRKDLPGSSRKSAAELRDAPWACRVAVETSCARRCGIQHDVI